MVGLDPRCVQVAVNVWREEVVAVDHVARKLRIVMPLVILDIPPLLEPRFQLLVGVRVAAPRLVAERSDPVQRVVSVVVVEQRTPHDLTLR